MNPEDMNENQKQLFIQDLKAVCGEYFDEDSKYSVDIAPCEKGLSVCIVFSAVRVRKLRTPN